MTNIVTRKGLAFGALVALASTAIAGAPAHAAGEINFAPSAGTSYNVSATDTFTLNASLAAGQVANNIAQLKYKVETDGSFIAKAVVTSGGQSAFNVYTNATGVANSASNAGSTGVGYTGTTTRVGNYVAANVQTAKVIAPVTGSNFPTSVTPNTIAISVDSTLGAATSGGSTANSGYDGVAQSATSATKSVTVTAWIDSNNDGVVDAGEYQQARTVTFKKYSEITPTVALVGANTGDNTIAATADFGDLNTDQVSGEGVAFGYSHGSTPTVVALATSVAGTLASGKWSLTTAGALASGTTAYAQSFIGSTLLGSAVSGTVVARTISSLTASAAAGDNNTASTGLSTPFATDVRIDGAWVAKVKAMDTASTPVAAANVAVKATVAVTGATLAAAATNVTEVSVTVAGTKYTSATALAAASFPVTTGADGFATLAISTSGFAAGNKVSVTFTAQNISSVVEGTSRALTYAVTNYGTSSVVATDKNTATTLTYSVKDQFGVLSAATNQRINVSATNATTASTQFVPVVAGKATFSVTPATDSTTTVVVTSTLDTSAYNSSTQNTTWTVGSSTGVTVNVNVRAAAYSFSTAPAVDGTNGINNGAATTTTNGVTTANSQKITQLDLAGLNSTTSVVAVAAGDVYAKLTFTGSNAGEKITVSGTGVYVSIDGVAATADSATKVVQAASGVVYVASNTVGTKTITFTNGTVTKTVDVKFASAGGTVARGTATNFAVAVPAAAQSGRAIDATVTVTDKWGNPVAGFIGTASVSGVAVVNGGYTAAIETDAGGKATVKLSAGVNDLGDAVITFSDNDTNTTTNVTSVAKTVTFGSTDGYIDVLNGKRASVTWSFAKGKRVAVYLDGVRRYNIVQPGDSELNLQFNLKKGSHSIKVVIGGVIVDTLSVKVAG